ncbi:class I SAM-dependent methyltransferase [Chroococcidiopsis sp. TS-821]|uniref:class I SAM-dependent methyltransferase n=1 Tax=Chroococcidiopsis sp. TS-821 TaxID=1378066 RepID=UPI000CEEA26F|nr:class I SAM-dependent methyltransferase [Chroococcidiopsis sp. TS-821]PPS43166.1 hypothetical protein B1A85_10665 [Chroococcidiopsis sp. TS-821]
MIQLFIRLSPPPYKQKIREIWLQYLLHRTIRKIASMPLGQIPTRKMLADLQLGWGNYSFAANLDYLEAVAKRAIQASEPILECGSGLTTIILGLLAGRRGVAVFSFEHMPQWRLHVLSVLQKHGIPAVNVCLAPLQDYGNFAWYKPPLSILPQQFELIICDGPPGKTPGGRYGLLPVMRQYFSPTNTILLDDADRPGEMETLEKWRREAGVKVEMQQMPQGTYAVITHH